MIIYINKDNIIMNCFDSIFGTIDLFYSLVDNFSKFNTTFLNRDKNRLYGTSVLSSLNKKYLGLSKVVLCEITCIDLGTIGHIRKGSNSIPLKYCTNLFYLSCRSLYDFTFLNSLKQMSILDLSNSYCMNDFMLDTITDNCPRLCILYINNCKAYNGLTSNSITRLLTKCCELKIINLSRISPHINKIDPNLFKNFHELYFGFNYLEQEFLINIIKDNNKIETIDFNFSFNPKCIRYFKSLYWLRTRITIDLFGAFSSCENLRDISLTGNFIIIDAVNLLCTYNKNITALRLNVSERSDLNAPIDKIALNLKNLHVIEFMHNFDKTWYNIDVSKILNMVLNCDKLIKLGIGYTTNINNLRISNMIRDIIYERA